ncbi:MAG TPA: tetratricopeptide repeat protein [Candidatus Bathyarchaeia archaeon]|nr:tetratricopeptide repeat protein [Candidatus Bathyarchaeia archaeon]
MAQYKAEMQVAAEAASKNDGKGAGSHEESARKYLKDACDQFAAADAGKSDDVSVLRDYAGACLKNDDYDLAASAFERATKIEPADASLWASLGYALTELGPTRANAAAAAFHKAVGLNPGTDMVAGAYVGLGEVYRRQSLYGLARESYQNALEVKPEMRAAKLALAAARVRDGEVLEASNDLDALGAMSNEEAGLLGTLLTESLQAFEAARLVFPETHEHHLAYAKLLLRAGKMSLALSAAERAAALGPGDYVTWNMIGSLSRQGGNVKRTKEAYTKSLEIKPDQPRTREALQALGN